MSKVILVTGASRGVGHAISKILIAAPANHKLVLTARSEGPLKDLCETAPERVVYSTGDLSRPESARKAVELAINKFGRLDGLILNHGILGRVGKVADLEFEDWQECFATNLFSAAYFCKLAIPHLRTTNGRIVLVSSGAASNAYQGWGPYGATKAAMNHLCQTLSVEEKDITTIAVRPGMVDTGMQRAIREDHKHSMNANDMKKFIGVFEEGKLVRPEQCGAVIANLAVEAAQDLTGQFVAWNDEAMKKYRTDL